MVKPLKRENKRRDERQEMRGCFQKMPGGTNVINQTGGVQTLGTKRGITQGEGDQGGDLGLQGPSSYGQYVPDRS